MSYMRYVNIDIISIIRLTNLMYYRLLIHDVVYHSISYRTIIASSVTVTITRTRQNFEPDVNNCAVYIPLDFSCKSESQNLLRSHLVETSHAVVTSDYSVSS